MSNTETRDELELRTAVWPHIEAIANSNSGENIAEAAAAVIEIVKKHERRAAWQEFSEAIMSGEVIDNAAAERDWAGCQFSTPIDRSRWLHLNEGIKEWEREQARATIASALAAAQKGQE